MKKFLLSMLICGTIVSASAQTKTTIHHRYYYYTSSNVYYDEENGSYWYWDNAASKWVSAPSLPPSITVTKSPRYLVRYNGDDPWKNNDADRIKYKVKKNGKVKIKPKG